MHRMTLNEKWVSNELSLNKHFLGPEDMFTILREGFHDSTSNKRFPCNCIPSITILYFTLVLLVFFLALCTYKFLFFYFLAKFDLILKWVFFPPTQYQIVSFGGGLYNYHLQLISLVAFTSQGESFKIIR